MFTIAPPQSGTLTAVGDTLTYDDQALAADERTAASNTHLFIQEVALARCKSNGVNVGDPNLYRSSTWFDALTWAIANHATWVEIVGAKAVSVSNSTHSGSINLSAIMGAVMTLYLGPEASAEWEAVSNLLGGASDPAVTNFMDFWWSHVSKSSTDTGLSVGPVIKSSDGYVQWAVCYYSMTEVINDWRTMFISSTFESIDISAGGLTLQFDMGVYNSDVKADLEKRLGADIRNKIDDVSLDSGLQGGLGASAPSPGSFAQQIGSATLLAAPDTQLASSGW